jgi:tetratricopeptide (TPR) repeat protein
MPKKLSSAKPGPLPPASDPITADDFAARGWTHYSKKECFRAEADFRKALEITPDQPDHLYGLALSLQASGRPVEAVQAFENLLQILEKPSEFDRVRYLMTTRLVKGHINRIKTGDWKLDI